jgi:hypothetical protein
MPEYPFYRLATIGWANPLLRDTVSLLKGPPADVIVDLSDVTFVDPFGVTYLAACVQRGLEQGSRVRIRPPRDGAVSTHLQNVGFYQSFGIGEHFPARRPSSPDRVDLVHIKELEPGFIDRLLDFLEVIQPFKPGLRSSMRLALIELVQNFAEHSGSLAGAWASGQFHPYSKETKAPRVTLCVLDLGRGIPATLRTVKEHRRCMDKTLVERATIEGVSSAGPSRGWGLSTIRKFVKSNGGTMTIVSGAGRVRFKSDRRAEPSTLAAPFPGTAVFLSLVPTARGLYVLSEANPDVDDLG